MKGTFTHIRDLLTGKDNKTPDLARYSWLFANAAIVAAAGAQVFKGIPVSLESLATALGIANVSGGASTAMNNVSQPQPATMTTAADSDGNAVSVARTEGAPE